MGTFNEACLCNGFRWELKPSLLVEVLRLLFYGFAIPESGRVGNSSLIYQIGEVPKVQNYQLYQLS